MDVVIRVSQSSGGFISTREAETSSRDEHSTFCNSNSVSTKLSQTLVHSHILCALVLPATHFLPTGCFPYFCLVLLDFFPYLFLSVPHLLLIIGSLLEVRVLEIPETDLCWQCSQQTKAEPGLFPSPSVSIAWQCCSSQELAGYSGMFFSSFFFFLELKNTSV